MSAHPEPAVPPDGGLRRVRLDVAYDGTAFSGWARQPGRRTVQGVLEDALATVLRVPVALAVAGRTDAGVHARGQVASADVPDAAWRAAGTDGHGRAGDPAERTLRRLRGVLPPDVAVRALAPAPAGFDARFSALRRRYAYRVDDAPGGPDPLRRADTLAHPRPLDVTRMQAAAAPLHGLHDFLAYCRPREGATTVRTLQRLDWVRDDAGVLVAVVEADAFCHSMVRSLVGALLAVGDGRRPEGWPAELLAAAPGEGRASVAAPVAPAHGLTLLAVDYPPDVDLAARAAETRARRSP